MQILTKMICCGQL